MAILIGTAGWSLPRAEQELFPAGGSHLVRYATRFRVAEINSSFHRSHRPGTWERWRDSVPEDFRFAVKVPKTVTHTGALKNTDESMTAFLRDVSLLENRLGALLVQLPPKLGFDRAVAETFFRHLLTRTEVPIVCEPRHASWFDTEADQLLETFKVARAAADPARLPTAAVPGGCRGLSYYRLHGSPKIYYSAYSPEFIGELAQRLKQDAAANRDVWVIFDNTTLGAATRNALQLVEQLDNKMLP